MARSGIRAGKAYVELYADDSRLARGLKVATNKVNAFGSKMMGVGRRLVTTAGIVGAAFAGSVRHFMKTGDRLGKMSRQVAMSVEFLSRLAWMGERSGTSIEGLNKGIRRMSRFSTYLQRGLSSATDAMEMLGLSTEEYLALDPDGQFQMIMRALSDMEEGALRGGIAQEIFGRSGMELLPLADMWGDLAGQASEFEISEEAALAAEKLTDAWTDLWSMTKLIVFEIGYALSDALMTAFTFAKDVLSVTKAWVKQNKRLFLTIAIVTSAVFGIGAALIAAGLSVKLFALSLAGLITAFSILGSIIAFVFTPMGLIAASLVAMGVALYKTRDMWMDFASTVIDSVGDVASTVADKFTRMWKIAWGATREYFGAIVNYIKAGQIENAFEVAVLGIQLLWQEATIGMRDAWAILVASIAANMDWLKSFLSSGWAGFKNLFLDLVDNLKIAWYKFSDIIVSAVMGPLQKVYNFLNKMMQKMPDFLMPDYMKNMFDVDLGDWTNNVDKIIKDIEDVKAARKEAFEEKFGELPDIEQLAGEYANAMVSGNEEALKDLRKRYREAVAAAHSEGVKEAIGQGRVDPKDNAIGGDLLLGGSGVEREAAGFFSPFAAGRSPAVAVQQEIASNTKQTNLRLDETNRNLTKINRKMDGNRSGGMEIT